MPLPAIENLIPLALVAGGGLVAWGELRSKVNGIRKDVEDKAEKDVVNVQFNAVIERLDRIERGIDKLANGAR